MIIKRLESFLDGPVKPDHDEKCELGLIEWKKIAITFWISAVTVVVTTERIPVKKNRPARATRVGPIFAFTLTAAACIVEYIKIARARRMWGGVRNVPGRLP
jgi:hypothetical protein